MRTNDTPDPYDAPDPWDWAEAQADTAWDRLELALGAWLLKRFRRREYTVNAADPTQVVSYATRGHAVTLAASWGVDLRVRLWGARWRCYDAWPATWLHGLLEAAHHRNEADLAEDPYGESYRDSHFPRS